MYSKFFFSFVAHVCLGELKSLVLVLERKTLPSPEVRSTLVTLGSAIKGLVVMSAALEVAAGGLAKTSSVVP